MHSRSFPIIAFVLLLIILEVESVLSKASSLTRQKGSENRYTKRSLPFVQDCFRGSMHRERSSQVQPDPEGMPPVIVRTTAEGGLFPVTRRISAFEFSLRNYPHSALEFGEPEANWKTNFNEQQLHAIERACYRQRPFFWLIEARMWLTKWGNKNIGLAFLTESDAIKQDAYQHLKRYRDREIEEAAEES